MQDLENHLEKLRRDAAECQLICELATDLDKRQLFARLAEHQRVLAAEIQRAIEKRLSSASPD
jgi:hypothetical protein